MYIFNVFSSFYIVIPEECKKNTWPRDMKLLVTEPIIRFFVAILIRRQFFKKESNASRTLLHRIIAIPVF